MKHFVICTIMVSLLTAEVAFSETGSTLYLAKAHASEKERPLGDLSNYLVIAKDTLKIVKGGDVKAGRARIKDLESAWDDAEEMQQPMSPDDWEVADKAIDRALAKLRSGRPDKSACIAALESLISTLERLNKTK